MQKKLYFGSNLKMYKNIQDTVAYLQKLVENTKDISRDEIELFIIPSYTTLESATKNVDRDYVLLGAQNMCWEDQGQFTGEISPLMLKELGLDLWHAPPSSHKSLSNNSGNDGSFQTEPPFPSTNTVQPSV